MAELRRSSGNGSSAGGAGSLKVPNGSAAAAYSGPFDGRRVEYSEIFGCLSGSCSIPVLDLPPAIDVHQAPAAGRSSGFDSEIFGGLDGGDFAVSYEELVAERDKVEEALSSNGRVPEEDISQQAPDASGTFQNGLCSHRVALSDTNQSSSNSNKSDNGFMQFNMSFHKTRQGDIKNAVREEMHITQLHTIPGITSDAEMRAPLHNIRSDTSSRVPEDFNLNVDLNDRKSEVRQGMISPSFSSANSEGSEKELKIDQRQFDNESPASEDGPANFKQHSCSSSSRSTSSGDILYPDVTYLTASNISLRTKPLRVPPPSRPPPKLLNSQELPKMNFADSIADIDVEPFSKPMVSNKKYGGWDTSRRHAPRVSLRDASSFLDVEVDASSAAASSAAAIKEAMEQAQAKLKSAKASMERKRDNLQSRKKPDQHEGGDQKERKADKAARDMKIFSQDVLEKRWVKEDIKKKEFVLEEQQKVKGASKLATDREEKERHVLNQRQHVMQVNELKSSQAYKLNDKYVEWKTDTQFYELINDVPTFGVFKETPYEDYAQEIPKVTIAVNKEEEKVAELAYEIEEASKKSKDCHISCRDDKITELPNTNSESCVQDQILNTLQDIDNFHQQVKDEKQLGEAQETLVCEEDIKNINGGDDAPAGGQSKIKLEILDDDCMPEGAHGSIEKLESSNFVSRHEDSDALSGTYGTCQPPKSETAPKLVNKTGRQNENGKKKEVLDELFMGELDHKVEAAQEPGQFVNFETVKEKAALECSNGEIENKLKGRNLSSGQEETKKLNRPEEVCMIVENDLEPKATQEDNKLEENLEKFKASNVSRHADYEKIKVVDEACKQDYNENGMRDPKLKNQQNNQKQNAAQLTLELENFEELTLAEPDHKTIENEKTREVDVGIDLKEYKMFNAVQDNTGSHTELTENTTDLQNKIEEENEARKLEEKKEREREREREKDRLAVERATREAYERAFAEARERAERIAVERVTAEARQRALVEAREKAERASAEALEKSLAEKASREARLRAERAAVERATAEARERAVERALAEKAAADARERVEKFNASSRDRAKKDDEAEQFWERDKGDGGTRDTPRDAQFQNDSSTSRQRHSNIYNQDEGESALRCKARLERNQRTVNRAAKALEEKNLRDIITQREQAEKNRLAETLNAEVRRWSNGKGGNLRALLSTLQYILGPESGWQPIPLTDVITAAAVKKAYRKATLCVHPDKLQQRGASIEQKYICDKVYDLLKEAWNQFNSEER